MLGLVDRAGGRCEVCGEPFEEVGPFAPSVDRIDCAGGYTPSNVRLVAHIVNVAMNAWGEAPLRRLATALAQPKL